MEDMYFVFVGWFVCRFFKMNFINFIRCRHAGLNTADVIFFKIKQIYQQIVSVVHICCVWLFRNLLFGCSSGPSCRLHLWWISIAVLYSFWHHRHINVSLTHRFLFFCTNNYDGQNISYSGFISQRWAVRAITMNKYSIIGPHIRPIYHHTHTERFYPFCQEFQIRDSN